MALIKENLISDLKVAFSSAQNQTNNSSDPTETLVNAIADAIDNYLKSAEIQGNQFTVLAGIPTAGSPAAQITTAPGTVNGVGKIT